MIILNRPQTDPFFNLAAEEYLVKNTKEALFMLWQNTPAVVIGKHQNALKEINLAFLQEKGIPVIRRISGGGTVFHDLGNLNYSFIDFGARETLVNFKKYSQPILDVLQILGIDAQFVGKSDLKIKDLKFSGNASHVHKNTVLHHGTLLFSSELNTLYESITTKQENYTDKAVQSSRSRVTNIQSHLSEPLSLEDFKHEIFDYILMNNPRAKRREFTENEIFEIQKMAQEKYKSWEWNFGYSPRYEFEVRIETSEDLIRFGMRVKNGLIESFDLKLKTNSDLLRLLDLLIGSPHQSQALLNLYDKNTELFKQLRIDKEVFLKAFIG